MNTEAVLFGLIRSVICGEAVSEELKAACTPERLEAVYTLAVKQDLAHLVGQALSMLTLPECETQKKSKKAAVGAFGRYVRLEREYQQVCQTLEAAQIYFIPLKGAVLRAYYPEPWMRTSCDVDILVQKRQLNAASKLLTETLGYRLVETTGHDLSFYSPTGIHIELHFDLVEDGRANASAQVLSRAWEAAKPLQGYHFWHEMSDAYFYFYHIAHMAKHFETGGCGVRPFVDLWLLDNRVTSELTQRDELLQAGNLLQFAQAVRKLSRVWLAGEEEDPLSKKLQDFLLHGGLYGSAENRIALKKTENFSRGHYLRSRIFAPYEKLKAYYPILEKYRWLMPVMQVRRWFMLLKPSVFRMAKSELVASKCIDTNKTTGENLMEAIGLHPSNW